MFDFTKQIQLPPAMKKIYAAARVALYFVFLLAALFVSYLILFPAVPLDFFLNSPTSSKNTLSQPQLAAGDTPIIDGKVNADDKLVFSANPLGQFSRAKINFTLENKKSNISGASVLIKKSYQAFRYPEGIPLGFKDGTLLTTPAGAYYLISNGQLRKFSGTDIILKLGYPKSSFIEVADSDLAYNQAGDEISDQNSYPNSTLFLVNDTFYMLQNGQLFPFVSARAFLSRFDAISAIAKNEDFLNKYPISETQLGFADGTLASSDESAYILSGDKSYPIMNPETFVAMGFNWDDIIPATQDELNIYKKQKQFTYRQPHPDGTLFFGKVLKKYFVIENGTKRPILSDAVAKTFSKQKPIVVDIQGAEISTTCSLKKQLFDSKEFECQASLQNLMELVGGDYQITTTFPVKANLDTVGVVFSTPVDWQNMKISLGSIRNRILTKWQK